MSIENGERFLRMLKANDSLRDRVRAEGLERFEALSAEAGASCTAYEVVAAVIRDIEGTSQTTGGA